MKIRVSTSIALGFAFVLTGCNNGLTPTIFNPNSFNFQTISNIGSTADPTNGDKNPYGLAIAPISSGLLTGGDLVVCNFNSTAGTEGAGTTAEYMHPAPGSTDHRFFQGASILGCGSVSVLADDRVVVTGKIANDVEILNPNGTPQTTLSGAPFNGPWGSVFASSVSKPAIYVSNANDGKLLRINILGPSTYSNETIATGFSVNGGAPGSIFAPYGMAYNPVNDTLYIVETNSSKLIAIANVSSVAAGGILVSGGDSSFGGASGSSARVVLSGSPLNHPLGATLLANGNIAVANSGDNLMIVVTPAGTITGTKNLDTGAVGALFSFAAALNGSQQQIVYFVDSNDDTLKLVGP